GDGDLFEQRTDMELGGYGLHYEFKRTYRSRVQFQGTLGYSWDHNYNKRMIGPYCLDASYYSKSGGVDYQDGELNIIHFNYSGSARSANGLSGTLYYAAPAGVPLTLTYVWCQDRTGATCSYYNNVFILRDADGVVTQFDSGGYVQRITDLAG